MIFPFVIPIIFPLIFPLSCLFMALLSMLGVWWPVRLMCAIFRLQPVLLIARNGEIAPGFLRRNAIGNVLAYEGIVPTFGEAANQDGSMSGILHTKWVPMP